MFENQKYTCPVKECERHERGFPSLKIKKHHMTTVHPKPKKVRHG